MHRFSNLNHESLADFRKLYFHLAEDTTHSVLLDSCGWQGKTGGLYRMAFDAEEVIQLKQNEIWVNGQFLQKISNKHELWEFLSTHVTPHPNPLPKGEGDTWFAALSYELNHVLEPSIAKPQAESPMGLLYLVRFKHHIVWQPAQNYFEILSESASWKDHVKKLCNDNIVLKSQLVSVDPPQLSMTPELFEQNVNAILSDIQNGNLYQANLSMRFESQDVSDSMLPALYTALVEKNPSPFSGVFNTPEGIIVSNSPERLVKYDSQTNIVETRPIAGTRGRGSNQEEDAVIGHVLQTDMKEQAEHLMLLDLERNDLGRIAKAGTVHTPEVCVLEQYSHVTHLVSQVEGRKASDKTSWEILDAMFPGGTITGCPKIRCMERLSKLESVPRWFYTGSFGYIDEDGSLDFNILIRSLFRWPDGKLHYHAGAGIVADSRPLWEYRECLRKAEAIQGILAPQPVKAS